MQQETTTTGATGARTKPPFRADHVGSLLRPPQLRKAGDAFQFLKETVTTNVPKLTIPSPSMVHYRGGRAAIDPDVYPDLDSFWADLVAAYREEVRRLGELGCTYLQFDDTSLAYMNDPHQREYIASIGGDPEHQHVEYIRHINEALAERPDGMSVTTHMCRGNFRSG